MTEMTKDLIAADEAWTLHGLFRERVARSPDAVAYREYDRQTGEWVQATWGEVAAQVARWRKAIAREGLKPGERVALSLRNSMEWVVFDQAALAEGLVVVPLYTDDRPDNTAFILSDAAVRLLLVPDLNRWHRMAEAVEEVPDLVRIVVLNGTEEAVQAEKEDSRVRVAAAWLADADADPEQKPYPSKPAELASIVYTSGTTGKPKGVMLSHRNMLSVAEAGLKVVDIYPDDTFLSFLPLSHTLERTAGYYLPMMAGSTVAYARSIGQLADDLATIQPTLMIAVPRIFERVHAKLEQQLASGAPLARKLFRLAGRVGWHRFERQQGRRWWGPSLLLWPLLRRVVAAKVLSKLGGRLRLVVSGGAPLMPAIARTFIGLGLPVLQGYGLTETAPQVSVNRMEDNDPFSVGAPLPGVEVKIGENNELLVRSPGVMMGYWNNHAATAAMIGKDGWLHTGDQARFDEQGRIFITGRIKDILVLSNGEKVPPEEMEIAISLDPLIEQVLVVGEGRSYLAALAVLNADLWPGIAQDLGLDPMSPDGLNDKRVKQLLRQRIAERLHDFPGYAKVRRVHATLEPWTVENGLLTPTMKTKRAKVMERYQGEVTALFEE